MDSQLSRISISSKKRRGKWPGCNWILTQGHRHLYIITNIERCLITHSTVDHQQLTVISWLATVDHQLYLLPIFINFNLILCQFSSTFRQFIVIFVDRCFALFNYSTLKKCLIAHYTVECQRCTIISGLSSVNCQ